MSDDMIFEHRDYVSKHKNWFDMEYSTQNKKEMLYLRSCGIRYTFVKVTNTIPTYKYTKTRELFEALVIFYQDK